MFSFFKKNKAIQPLALDFIGADMHNHLLPGIDDGSPDLDASMHLLEGMAQLGFRAVYSTPHVLGDVHPNTPETIQNSYEQYLTRTAGKFPEIKTGFAAEYMVDYDFETITLASPLLCLPGNYVLIEMSYAVESPNLREVIFQLQTKGYKPILAHPERYPYYYRRFSVFELLTDAGTEMQINLLSLGGYYGRDAQLLAEKLIAAGWVNWVGTDMHHPKHLEALQQYAASARFIKKIEAIKTLRNPELAG
jgi:tyrosine-protein phosphatase YwqE